MKIDSAQVKSFCYKALEGTNKIGESATNITTSALNALGAKKDIFLKENEKLKTNLNKNTLVGGIVLATAIALATSCIKSIVNKVKEVKNNK